MTSRLLVGALALAASLRALSTTASDSPTPSRRVQEGIALNHGVSSYCGILTVAFACCRRLMPDPDFYGDCVQASFEDLREALLGSTEPSTGEAAE